MSHARRGGLVFALALCLGALGSCSTALLDLLAFQVLSNEPAMLYLGYHDDETKGFGVARLGTTTGALEVLRLTVSADNINGCAVCMGREPISADFPWPWLYFTAESPNRVMWTQYNALEPATEVLATGLTDQINCIRVVKDTFGYPAVYWSTGSVAPVWGAGMAYTFSFDIEPVTYRIYYLGLSVSHYLESDFAVIGVNPDGSGELRLATIGHAVVSNLLLLDGYLYYVTQTPDAICRIKADGSEAAPTTLVNPTAAPQAVAVDPVDGTLYWVEASVNTPRRIMKAAAGATSGTPLAQNLPVIDPNGFFFYRP
jgi:hypothetical protein